MGRWTEITEDEAAALRRGRPSNAASAADNRREPRQRVHLRSGQISDRHHQFICACVVRDRSNKGARLLLPKNVAVPTFIWFYDDEYKTAVKAEVRWRHNQEIGILKLS